MRPAGIGTLILIACGLSMTGCCGGCLSHECLEDAGIIRYSFYVDSWNGAIRWALGGLAAGIVNSILLCVWMRSRPSSPGE